MAAKELVWDFYREVPNVENLGAQIHYYDMWAQNLYTSLDGLVSNICRPINGRWGTVESSYHVIDPTRYECLRFDHPSNGVLYGASIVNGNLVFLRYTYMEDISDIIESWDIHLNSDNGVQDINLDVGNTQIDLLLDPVGLFQPGSRMLLSFSAGNSEIIPMGVYWLDEVDIDITAESIPISGRNSIGYYLKDQTMDDLTKIQGRLDDTVKALLDHAGITNYEVQEFSVWVPFEFKSTESVLDALIKVSESVANPDPALSFNIVELPDGKILCGHQRWIASKYPNGYYTFEEGREVFSRSTKKMVDGVYTQVRCTGESEKDKPLQPVSVPITNHKNWVLGTHRTKHLEAPRYMTQEELTSWANTQAKKYQYVGIGEEFISPFRPHLIPKDVARISRNGTNLNLGLITEVDHSFSLDDGYVTEFTVDSGGIETDGDNYTVYADVASLNGVNRKQTVTDLMKILASK